MKIYHSFASGQIGELISIKNIKGTLEVHVHYEVQCSGSH
jgi:hypothetical protein